MKAKIFAKLKQEYSSLGLGDEILMNRAEMLAATGLVTDDNIVFVVAAQKREMEEQQKLNDKRVNDALEKERKKHADELAAREKAEKEAADAKAKAEAEAKAKAEAEAKAKAEEEAKAKAAKEKEEAEAAARKKLEQEGKLSPELAAMLKKEREEANARLTAYETSIKEMMEKNRKLDEERANSLNEMRKSYEEQMKSIMESSTALKQSYDALKKENDEAKAAQAKAAREQFILSKAQELGVPQWRIDEGFVLAPEADENAIAETLAKVANNIKTQQLPGTRNVAPLGDNKPTAQDIKDLAASIVK